MIHCFISKGEGISCIIIFLFQFVVTPFLFVLLEVHAISHTGDTYAWFKLLISRVFGYGRL